MTTTNEIFTYSWNIDEDEKEITCIRVYGLDKLNNNICIRINNFYPWIYRKCSRLAQLHNKVSIIHTNSLLNNQSGFNKSQFMNNSS